VTPLRRRLAVFALLLAWCALLLGYRVYRTGSLAFTFLTWNLLLAAVPAAAALLFARSRQVGAPLLIQAAWFVVWLLFLPNAPYILTDFVHLQERPEMPLWYDIALLLSGAGTGLLLGYASVADVQEVISRSAGRAAGWFTAIGALLLSGFGIYVGRYLRWNSWDAFTAPLDLFRDISGRALHPDAHPRTLGVTLIYGAMVTLGYVAIRAVGGKR
jgi:uncharacterized membrane protein